jgi:predicted phage terminase large subunit-like protein
LGSASTSQARSQTLPRFQSSFSANLAQRLENMGLDKDQWDQALSLSLRGLAKSTDGIEGVISFGEYVFRYEAEAHHRQMLEFILDCILHRENGLVLEPRGAAKTTWGNTIFLSWLSAMYPDIRIGLVSNTSTQSNDFSRAIRWTYQSNPRFIEIFGDCVSPGKWTDLEWLHAASKWHGSKDVTLFSVGVGGAVISKRFDILLLDDVLDEENTQTPEAREKVETWFYKTLMPCLVPDGVVIALGTRWAEDDLYGKLMEKPEKGGKGWRSLVVSALHEDRKTGTVTSYWDSHWPVWRLQDKRIELGTPLFLCAYQNDVRGLMAGSVFLKRYYQYFDQLPEGKSYTIRMGIDLASSEKERADFTARCITAQDEDGNFYVLSVYRDKRETGHASFIVDGWMAYPGMALVKCEKNQFQSTLVQEVMRDYPWIPIEGQPTDSDKTTRARAVAAKYEAHKVFHHISLKDSEFEQEQLSFPKGHDDMIDAEGFSMDLSGGGFFFGSVRR